VTVFYLINLAEYQAVFRALEIAKTRQYTNLQIRTDSNLLVRSMNEWMPKWKKNGWKTAGGAAVKNRDLLEKIDGLQKQVNASFVHVDGHAGKS
jgi:ribonuclease HI